MALKPGPMKVIHNFFKTKDEVLDDIKKLDLWPSVYVSDRMDELPPHWHDIDNCGYVMQGSYVLNEKGERLLGPGDKLHIPAGAIHAEGKVEEQMIYIVIIYLENYLYLIQKTVHLNTKKFKGLKMKTVEVSRITDIPSQTIWKMKHFDRVLNWVPGGKCSISVRR